MQTLSISQVAARLNLTEARVRQLDAELEPIVTARGKKQKVRVYVPEIVERVARTRVRYMHSNVRYDPDAKHFGAAWRVLWCCFKTSADTRGIEHSIGLAEFVRISTEPCTYCGEPPKERKRGRYKLIAHGVDRLDNTCGYNKSNAVSCCWDCNRFKGEMTVEEFITHARRIAAWVADMG